jgi:hypothetical protein
MIISVIFSIKVRWGQIDVCVHLYNNEMSYKMKQSIKYAKRFVLSVSCIYYYTNEMNTEQLTKETSILVLLSTDCLLLYVTWRAFVFSNQFDLNLFMITTENSSIFRLRTKESMLLTSATFLIEKRS